MKLIASKSFRNLKFDQLKNCSNKTERIRKIHLTIARLKEKTEHFVQKLKTDLPGALFERVVDFTKKAQLSQHTKTKERHIKKFLNLQNKKLKKIKTGNERQTIDHIVQGELQDR